MKSTYYNVTKSGDGGRYKVQITRKGKVFYLGSYEDVMEAASWADRYALASKAWARGAVSLNFSDSTAMNEPGWNDHMKAAMAWLRANYPEAEQEQRTRDRQSECLADFAEEGEIIKNRLHTMHKDVTAFMDSINAAATRQAQLHAADKRDLEWSRNRIAELEKEKAGRSANAELAKARGGSLFIKVASDEGMTPEEVETLRVHREKSEIEEKQRLEEKRLTDEQEAEALRVFEASKTVAAAPVQVLSPVVPPAPADEASESQNQRDAARLAEDVQHALDEAAAPSVE